MADRCFHGSPIENCADCLIERLTRERDWLKGELDKVIAKRDRLRALLREVEWAGDDECPFCGRWKIGHAPDCRLAAALEGRDG